MAENKKKIYEVTVKTMSGTLDYDIFRKMASNGDITSTSVAELVDAKISITGRATAHIKTEDKEFDMAYFDTNEYGIINCGEGTLFDKSYNAYKDDTEYYRVIKIKCKLGTAFKAVPVMTN